MKKVIAFQIAESIDIKKFRKEFTDTENHMSSSDIFYTNEKDQYLYLLSYGVVVFVGYDELKMSDMIEYIKPLCKNLLPEKMREEFIINTTTNKDAFEYNESTSVNPILLLFESLCSTWHNQLRWIIFRNWQKN
jgi:required for meiotic nuclear division protein 1